MKQALGDADAVRVADGGSQLLLRVTVGDGTCEADVEATRVAAGVGAVDGAVACMAAVARAVEAMQNAVIGRIDTLALALAASGVSEGTHESHPSEGSHLSA